MFHSALTQLKIFHSALIDLTANQGMLCLTCSTCRSLTYDPPSNCRTGQHRKFTQHLVQPNMLEVLLLDTYLYLEGS